MYNLVILGQTVLQMYDCLTLYEQRQQRQRRRRPTDPIAIGQNGHANAICSRPEVAFDIISSVDVGPRELPVLP